MKKRMLRTGPPSDDHDICADHHNDYPNLVVDQTTGAPYLIWGSRPWSSSAWPDCSCSCHQPGEGLDNKKIRPGSAKLQMSIPSLNELELEWRNMRLMLLWSKSFWGTGDNNWGGKTNLFRDGMRAFWGRWLKCKILIYVNLKWLKI